MVIQVIDTGLALAKPRECKDDDGVQVTGVVNANCALHASRSSALALPAAATKTL
jgi:hypothetical protein